MKKIFVDYLNNSYIRSNKSLLKFRIWFHTLNYCYMIVMVVIFLRIDFTAAEDPLVRLYHTNRWLLITSWFNFISLAYTPICIYCDWCELRGTGNPRILTNIRLMCFSSLLFPVTCFSDIFFWRLWVKNRDLVAPAAVDVLVPLWMQHCLHTGTLIVIVVDLLTVPKRKPKNLTAGVIVLTLFLAIYAVTCGYSIVNNEHLYPLLRLFSGYNFIHLVIFVSVEHFFYFTIQWLVVDLIWGKKTHTHALVSLLTFFQLEIGDANIPTERLSGKDSKIRKFSTNKIKIS